MGFWSKFGKGLVQAWNTAKEVAPVLPIPDKAKRVIAKGGEVEDDVKAIIQEVKPPTPE